MPCSSAGLDAAEAAVADDTGQLALSDGVFAHLVRSSQVGIVVSSAADGTILDVNDAFLGLFQYDRVEVIGRTSTDLGMWADPNLRTALVAALETSTPLRDFEAEVVTSTGEVRQVLVSVEVIDIDGDRCLLSQLYDTTERRRLEERLQTRERRYRAIFDNTFQFTGLLTPDGTLLEANQTALDFAGLAIEDVTGRPFWEAHWWTLSGETQARLQRAIAQVGEGEFVRYEVDVRGRGDVVARIDFSLKPLRDESGRIIHVIPEGRDVTELRRVESELLKIKERFRSAFEWSPIGMALVGLDGRWLEVNRALCAIVGYNEDELRARTFQDITHPDDLEPDLTQARRLIAGKIPSYQLEKRYIRKDGQTIWVLLTGSLVHAADGSAHSALAQVVDITGRKRAEQETELALEVQRTANAELERLSRAQRDFLSVVTHEFRTPLTSILGYSEILQSDGVSPEEITEFAGIIGNNAQRLGRMVDDLLDLDRLETGRAAPRLQSVDLSGVLDEVATAFLPNGATHKISLDLEPDLPHVAGDRDRLVQVVTNLVDNAVKYSPQHGEITMAARHAGDTIHLEVRDRGIGIPAGALETIFDRYARVETGTTRRIRGTGLGLAIVREIIDAHGGRVWAESEQSVGSTFHVIVPTRDASHDRPAAGGDGSSGARSTV